MALAAELAAVRSESATQTARLRQTSDETDRFRQTSETALAELRQTLQHERERSTALAQQLASARMPAAGAAMAGPTRGQPPQAATPAGTVQPATAGNALEAARLVARAGALLGQGDIGSARTVLERAAEMGSARASFMLAETYDPRILATWGTYGTRGEVVRARELYARAQAGGIAEAKDRVEALRRAGPDG